MCLVTLTGYPDGRGLPQQQKERAVDLLNPHATPNPKTRLHPAHLLQGEGEVGRLSSLTGIQQQVFLPLAEQGDGA